MHDEEPLGSYRTFQDYRSGVDSAVTLFSMAQALATDASLIVEVGCGRGALVDEPGRGRRMHDLRAPHRTVMGIDVDPVGADNPVIDKFALIEDGRWPLDTGSVDLAYCDWVLEHVTDPPAFVAELTRVLRPGGAFLARTVSLHSPVSFAARHTAHERHADVVAQLQPGRSERDVFPTAYRMNDRKAIKALFDRDYEWALSFHPGLEHYLTRWPRLARAAAAVEVRLPKRNQHMMILAARKRITH